MLAYIIKGLKINIILFLHFRGNNIFESVEVRRHGKFRLMARLKILNRYQGCRKSDVSSFHFGTECFIPYHLLSSSIAIDFLLLISLFLMTENLMG